MPEDKVGFQCYEYQGKPVQLAHVDYLGNLYYEVDTSNLRYLPPKTDTRSRYRKVVDEVKKRLAHAWYALKGGECD